MYKILLDSISLFGLNQYKKNDITARLGWRTRCFPFSSLSITYSFTRLSNYLLIYLLIYLFIYLFTHLSVYLLTHLLIYPFTCLFINPYLNINFPLFYFPFFFVFLYLLIYFRPCIQFYLYIHPFIYSLIFHSYTDFMPLPVQSCSVNSFTCSFILHLPVY